MKKFKKLTALALALALALSLCLTGMSLPAAMPVEAQLVQTAQERTVETL